MCLIKQKILQMLQQMFFSTKAPIWLKKGSISLQFLLDLKKTKTIDDIAWVQMYMYQEAWICYNKKLISPVYLEISWMLKDMVAQ